MYNARGKRLIPLVSRFVCAMITVKNLHSYTIAFFLCRYFYSIAYKGNLRISFDDLPYDSAGKGFAVTERTIRTNLNATVAPHAPVIIKIKCFFTKRNCPPRTDFPALSTHAAASIIRYGSLEKMSPEKSMEHFLTKHELARIG